jgi:hypothetical protein
MTKIRERIALDDFGWNQELIYKKIGKIVIDSKDKYEIIRLYGDVDDSSFIEIIENVDRVDLRPSGRLKVYNDFHLRGERYLFGRNFKVIKRHFLTRKDKNYYEVIIK